MAEDRHHQNRMTVCATRHCLQSSVLIRSHFILTATRGGQCFHAHSTLGKWTLGDVKGRAQAPRN